MASNLLNEMRVHENTTPDGLADALSTLKTPAYSARRSWRQAVAQDNRVASNLMHVISFDRVGKPINEITHESVRLRSAMNTLGFGGAEYDSELNPGVRVDTLACILNRQAVIRRGHVPNIKAGDIDNFLALSQGFAADPLPPQAPVVQEYMGISPNGIPLQSLEACLTLLGVDYTIEEDRYALIKDSDSIIAVLQCKEHYLHQGAGILTAQTHRPDHLD